MGSDPDRAASTLRRGLTGLLLGAALATFATGVPSARADDERGFTHRITDRGETYEDLAVHYYGRRELALHLRLFNRRAEPLARGTTIILPTFAAVPLKRGQTLEQFAEANLNEAMRAEYLAELHGLRGAERTTPRPGTPLNVVPSLRHEVRPGESLRSIARIYYVNPSAGRTRLLALFNGLAQDTVRAGQTLRIPLDEPEFSAVAVAERARRPFERAQVETRVERSGASEPGKKDQAGKKRHAQTTRGDQATAPGPSDELPEGDAKPEATKDVRADGHVVDRDQLQHTCDDGLFAACEASARQLFDALPGNATALRVDVLRLRAIALVALGKTDDARSTFKKLLELDPAYDLDLYRTSPKVLDVFLSVDVR